jgi:pimeloyl-ACP methyl ester carboxylesterase
MDTMFRESFALGELMQLMADPVWRGRGVPRGDGRIVQVLPGLFANDIYLQPLRRWLRRNGYRPVRSTLELNVGCPQRLSEQVEQELNLNRKRFGDPVAIIGHSRGGLLARAIAARLGEDASHLVLLGSPVGGVLRMKDWGVPPAPASVAAIAADPVARASTRSRQWMDPNCDFPACGCAYLDDLRRPLHPGTRVVSIFTPTDPIVPSAACHIDGARNVEVSGTHSGLAFNPAVYRVLAEELSR